MKNVFLEQARNKPAESDNSAIEAAKMAGAGVIPAFWSEVESEFARMQAAKAPKVEARLTRARD